MERREERRSRQAYRRSNARRADAIIADRATLDEIALIVAAGLMGLFMAYCLMFPDYKPMTKAQHDQMLAEQAAATRCAE